MWCDIKVSALCLWASHAIFVIKTKHSWQSRKTRDRSLHSRPTFVVETLIGPRHKSYLSIPHQSVQSITFLCGDNCILWPWLSHSWQNVCHQNAATINSRREMPWVLFTNLKNTSSFLVLFCLSLLFQEHTRPGVTAFVQTSADLCSASGGLRSQERERNHQTDRARESKVIHLKL